MSKPLPWVLDAYRFFYSPQIEDYLLLNKPIQEFLRQDDKFFLVGAKGLGKTLFLRYKSHQFHEKYGNSIHFNNRQTELTENLNIHPDTLTKEELLRFENIGLWRLIWELAFWIMSFRMYDLPINLKLERIVGRGDQLSTIVTRLLNNRGLIDEYREYVSEFIDQKRKISSGLAIFVDDVDQALHNALMKPHHTDTYYEGRVNPSVIVWINAQIGLVDAIYNINRQNGHIKIYATIRREAFEACPNEMKFNYRQHVSILHYEKDEIRNIFEKNIRLVEANELFGNKKSDNYIEQLLSFSRMTHPYAVDMHGNQRTETGFDFIFRHTYGRPRELMLMGLEINNLIITEAYRSADMDKRVSDLRRLVNKVSNELLNQYKQEIIPYLDEDKLREFIIKVRSNVLEKRDLEKLDKVFFRQLFNLGLIGYVSAMHQPGILKQTFKQAATYNYDHQDPWPDADFFVIHSTLDGPLRYEHINGNFHNRYNIIGDGYDFFPKMDNMIHEANYYIPADITGNRMLSSNGGGGHAFGLKDIYDNYFKFEDDLRRHEHFEAQWKIAEAVLGWISRICYCHRLYTQFKDETYREKEAECLAELQRYYFNREYNAKLPDADSDQAFTIFLDKLFGRYITLGCYLFLDMHIDWIYQLLRTGRFQFKHWEGSKDTPYTYLNRSFFIRELQKDEPNDPDNHAHRHVKQQIFNFLSDHEKDSLRNFVKNAADETRLMNWVDNPEHKNWLEKQVLAKIWQPGK